MSTRLAVVDVRTESAAIHFFPARIAYRLIYVRGQIILISFEAFVVTMQSGLLV
jgi:hypothetical protein